MRPFRGPWVAVWVNDITSRDISTKSSPKRRNVSGSWEGGKLSDLSDIRIHHWNQPPLKFWNLDALATSKWLETFSVPTKVAFFAFIRARRFFWKLCVKIGTYSSIFGQPNTRRVAEVFGDQRLKVLEISWGGWVVPWFLWLKWCWDRMPEIQLNIFFETCRMWSDYWGGWCIVITSISYLIYIFMQRYIPMSLGPPPTSNFQEGRRDHTWLVGV